MPSTVMVSTVQGLVLAAAVRLVVAQISDQVQHPPIPSTDAAPLLDVTAVSNLALLPTDCYSFFNLPANDHQLDLTAAANGALVSSEENHEGNVTRDWQTLTDLQSPSLGWSQHYQRASQNSSPLDASPMQEPWPISKRSMNRLVNSEPHSSANIMDAASNAENLDLYGAFTEHIHDILSQNEVQQFQPCLPVNIQALTLPRISSVREVQNIFEEFYDTVGFTDPKASKTSSTCSKTIIEGGELSGQLSVCATEIFPIGTRDELFLRTSCAFQQSQVTEDRICEQPLSSSDSREMIQESTDSIVTPKLEFKIDVSNSCQICGAFKGDKGKYVLPLDVITKQRVLGETIALIRQTLLIYDHHCYSVLSSKSYRALLSFKSIIQCYDIHCRGSPSEFERRHPRWGIRSFNCWNCSGKQPCDYQEKVKKRENRNLSSQEWRKRQVPGLIAINIQQAQDPFCFTQSNVCCRCGASRDPSGLFVIPQAALEISCRTEDQMNMIRTLYCVYSHHHRSDLTECSYEYLRTLERIVICHDHLCGGNSVEFDNRYPSLIANSFPRQCCSGKHDCEHHFKSTNKKRK